jgi:hypothetical protein
MPSVASESQDLLRNRAAYIGRAKHVSGNANQYQNAAGIQQSKATTATNKTATNKTTTFCFLLLSLLFCRAGLSAGLACYTSNHDGQTYMPYPMYT